MACDNEKNVAPGFLVGDLVPGKKRIPGPQSDCLACAERRVHSAEEQKIYHPFAAHGFTPEQGWTHKDLPNIDRYGGYKKK